LNRFIYIILLLVFGCFMLAGSGSFQPTATTSSIEKQSSVNSNQNKTNINKNIKNPVTEEGKQKDNQKDSQNNNQSSVNNGTPTEETKKSEQPKQTAQANQKNNKPAQSSNKNESTQPSRKNNQHRYRIEVSISEQKVRIYDHDTLIKEWIVSTGENDSTPRGDFVIQNRGEWFYSEKYQQGAMWWVSFKDWGIYLFHSVPMDRNRNIIQEEADKLGSPVSHGCVRLKVEDAKWIYDNIPQGTPVHIK